MESFTEKRIAATYKALDDIKKVIKYLKEAQSLGVADLMGGMILISKAKYAKLEEANDAEKKFEFHFRKMIDEPDFLPSDNKIRVEIEDSARILDIFFDNLAIDIIVQNKIENALLEAKFIEKKLLEIIDTIR